MEPERGINGISETLPEAKQDDVYCKRDAACLALVTACCVLRHVDFQSSDLPGTPGSSFPCQEQARALGVGDGAASGEGKGKAVQVTLCLGTC